MTDSSILWEERLEPASAWSHVLKRGTSLRLTDLEGGANVSALFYNFENPVERYNMADTLKAQHIARLTKGVVLYSDMGRILCSMTEDSLGWHDPLGGCSNAALVKAKYGEATYQEHLNNYYRNAADSFLTELAKYGLGERDLVANVNFFSKVAVGSDGSMEFLSNHSAPGSFVELRAEMNVLVVLNSCPHPLDPEVRYLPKPVQLTVKKVPLAGPDDPCRISRPENRRGYTLTERYFL